MLEPEKQIKKKILNRKVYNASDFGKKWFLLSDFEIKLVQRVRF